MYDINSNRIHPITGQAPAPILRIQYPSGREETIPLTRSPFRIGTADHCDLRITGDGGDGREATILRGSGGFLLRDGGDGVIRFHGNPIRSRVLRHGDNFEFGSPAICQIVFLIPATGNVNRDLLNLKMLIDITRSINSTAELSELFEKILDGSLEVSGAERAVVLLTETSGELQVTAWRRRGRDGPPDEAPRISDSIAREVARRGTSISVKEAQTHQDFRDRDSIVTLGLNTILCVPMKIHEHTLGVLYMDARGIVENLALTDFQVVESLAATAAIAIENVRLVEEKVQSERLSAVGQMASSFVHDMRGPMTSLQGFAELLREQAALDDKGKRYVDTMMGEIRRIESMAAEVLEFSRGRVTLNRTRRTAGRIVDEILPMLAVDSERGKIALDLDVERDVVVEVDPVKISRVLLNLTTNAINAMEQGGRLRIAAHGTESDLCLEVIDTGKGIPAEIQNRIWEPFFSHGKAHGTGLGMAIVRRIVDQHGGRIELESEPGRGTTVRVFLPRVPVLEPAVAPAPA